MTLAIRVRVFAFSNQQPLLQQQTYFSQLLFSLPVTLLHGDSCPVGLGCLQALGGHSGLSEADKNGVVGPSSSIQTNKVPVVTEFMAVNRKEEECYTYIPDKLHQHHSDIKYVEFPIFLFKQEK